MHANSHRVRTLRLQVTGPVHAFHVSDDIYQLFVDHFLVSHASLFPKLRGLFCTVSINGRWGTSTAHLLAESLARMYPLEWFHYIAYDEANIIDLARCLQVSADSLKSFHMSCRMLPSGHTPEFVSNGISQLRALENAEFNSPITSTALSHLATLPKLASLVLDFDHPSRFPASQALLPASNNFAALRDLRVTITLDRALTPVIALFDNIVPGRLRNVTVKFEWLPVVDDLTSLIRSIGRVHSLCTLDMYCSMRSMYKGNFVPAPGDGQRWPAPCSILSPLLGLKSLETLKIDALPLLVRPGDIATFAAAWPSLKVLHLSAEDVLTTTDLYLSELLPLITGCRSLEQLDVQLQEGGDPIAESTTAPSVRKVNVALHDPFPNDYDSDSADDAAPEEWWEWKRGWSRRLGAVFPHAEIETNLVTVGDAWL